MSGKISRFSASIPEDLQNSSNLCGSIDLTKISEKPVFTRLGNAKSAQHEVINAQSTFLILDIIGKMSKEHIQVIVYWYIMFALATNENLSSGCSQLFYYLSLASYNQKALI